MNTAVQLRPMTAIDLPRCELVYGEPHEIHAGRLGPIALFAAGQLVAYRLGSRRRTRLFVFRALNVDDPLAVAVPGVRPRVQLLLELRSAGRVRLAQDLFAYLRRTGREPDRVPDAFFLRTGLALSGRLARHKILPSLLGRFDPPSPVHSADSRCTNRAPPADRTLT